MCGIAGFIDYGFQLESPDLKRMVMAMNHRGPDDLGVKFINQGKSNIGLGQSRLSIIDLSEGGHQPMSYLNLDIVFNGEIYNFNEIKQDLINSGHKFTSFSDTEVILHAIKEWGIDAVHRFIGMFAIALYDDNSKELTLIRDRAGVKPLYYYEKDNLFLFGSELKALMSYSNLTKVIDEKVLPNFLQYGYISAPNTIFKYCKKLLPGHYMVYDISTRQSKIKNYWNTNTFFKLPKLNKPYEEAKEELEFLLHSAFQYRMVADVPVGVFLSGGYDSTAITALLQSRLTTSLQTFTIGFKEGNNEAPFAKETAAFLGTKHSEYICTTNEAQEIIKTLPYYFDEPFGDSSAIPTILVSKLAQQSVKVVLSGDGGDEIFCGYQSYFKLNEYLSKIDKVPFQLKGLANKIGLALNKASFLGNLKQKYYLESFLRSLDPNQLTQAQQLFMFMKEKPSNYIANFFTNDIISHPSNISMALDGFQNELEVAMAIDYNSYLPDDILTKVDRATMSVSIEGREPLLDHRISEFVAQLPLSYKTNGVDGKKILKDIVHSYVPKTMMERPKSGFSLPIYDWLRNDLSYLLDEYLSEDALKMSGLLNEQWILTQVNLFKEKKLHYQQIIWNLLMFQMWYKQWIVKNH